MLHFGAVDDFRQQSTPFRQTERVDDDIVILAIAVTEGELASEGRWRERQ